MPITNQRVAGDVPSLYEAGDTPRVRRSDPDTSHEAADKSAKSLSELKRIILDLFDKAGEVGFTDTELDDRYALLADTKGWPRVRLETPRKRRSDLSGMNLLIDSGETRVSRYGNAEIVWVLAGYALEDARRALANAAVAQAKGEAVLRILGGVS